MPTPPYNPLCQHLSKSMVCLAGALLSSALLAQSPAPLVSPAPSAQRELQAIQAAQSAYENGQAGLAQRRFTTLAKQGNAWAMYNLAAMHMQGEAKPSSSVQAKFWLEKAAVQAYPQALYVLGQAYEGGQFEAKNLAKAAQYYGLAAQAGSAAGRIEYATALYLGRGIPMDLTEAGYWYLEAAKAGDKDTQFMVARMFETGEGRPQDERMARYWYAAAAKNGDLPSQAKLFAYEREDEKRRASGQ